MEVPNHWFKPVTEREIGGCEPLEIEYLKMWTGETFVHTGGTVYWNDESKCLNIEYLQLSGITHYRILKHGW